MREILDVQRGSGLEGSYEARSRASVLVLRMRTALAMRRSCEAGAWEDPVKPGRAPALKGRFLHQDLPLRAQTLLPKRIARAAVGLAVRLRRAVRI